MYFAFCGCLLLTDDIVVAVAVVVVGHIVTDVQCVDFVLVLCSIVLA